MCKTKIETLDLKKKVDFKKFYNQKCKGNKNGLLCLLTDCSSTCCAAFMDCCKF